MINHICSAGDALPTGKAICPNVVHEDGRGIVEVADSGRGHESAEAADEIKWSKPLAFDRRLG
jgi:hypothetical protein